MERYRSSPALRSPLGDQSNNEAEYNGRKRISSTTYKSRILDSSVATAKPSYPFQGRSSLLPPIFAQSFVRK